MLKQSLIYLVLSILVVLFAKYLHVLIVYIDIFYTYVHLKLGPYFAKGGLGHFMSKVILLVIIPVLIACIPALLYRLIKGTNMPYLVELTWCLWLVIVLSNILIR